MFTRLRSYVLFILVLLIPSQLGYHWWPTWSYAYGLPIDFLSPTLFLTDIILLIFVFLSLPQIRTLKLFPKYNFVLLFIIAAVSLNTLFSVSPLLTLYKWLNVSKYLFFSISLYSHGVTVLPVVLKSLSLAVLWASILGWLQFIFQSSMGGWLWWLGERPLVLSLPGIALVPSLSLNIFDLPIYTSQILRAYSTFPHPNAFAGFLVLSGILLYQLCNYSSKPRSFLTSLAILVSLFTIFITFSRTAIIFIFLMYLGISLHRKRSLFIIFLLLGLLLFPILLKLGNPNSLSDRLLLISSSLTISLQHPILGAGLGTNPISLNLPQPVHNIFLLLISEIGYPLTIILLVTIVYAVFNLYRNSIYLSHSFCLGLLVVVATGFTDHYWLTLNQNISLLTIFITISAIMASAPQKYDSNKLIQN